jgi:hypothetical protein
MSGKLLIEWRHDICIEICYQRYKFSKEEIEMAHNEIVNLFFPQDADDSDDVHSETSEKSSKVYSFLNFLFLFWQGIRRKRIGIDLLN